MNLVKHESEEFVGNGIMAMIPIKKFGWIIRTDNILSPYQKSERIKLPAH